MDVSESNMPASDVTAMNQCLIWILLLVDPAKLAEEKFTKVKIRVNEKYLGRSKLILRHS